MPFKWKYKNNPYVNNYFGRLGIGPNVPPNQIVGQAKKLCQELENGDSLKLGEEHLDDHAVNEAAKELRQARSLAEELLLVHPHSKYSQKKIKSVVKQLHQIAVIPDSTKLPTLVYPLAIFWFLPIPGVDSAVLPDWDQFGFVEAGDEQDLELDIVFDS